MCEKLNYAVEHTVQACESALAMKSGDMEVFATPSMVALMEQAAMLAAKSLLNEGETTVGIEISTSHLKASRIGATIRSVAKLEERDGRVLKFSIAAYDGDMLIGKGTHSRFIVDRERFLAKL